MCFDECGFIRQIKISWNIYTNRIRHKSIQILFCGLMWCSLANIFTQHERCRYIVLCWKESMKPLKVNHALWTDSRGRFLLSYMFIFLHDQTLLGSNTSCNVFYGPLIACIFTARTCAYIVKCIYACIYYMYT